MTPKQMIIQAYMDSGFIETNDPELLDKDCNLFMVETYLDEEDKPEYYALATQDKMIYFSKDDNIIDDSEFWENLIDDLDDEFDHYYEDDE